MVQLLATKMRNSYPKNYTLIFSKEEISKRTLEIANDISSWVFKNGHQNNIAIIPLLNGGIFFAADLVRNFPFSVDIIPIKASAYESDGVEPKNKKVEIPDKDKLIGKIVLVVDDIYDTGSTLKVVKETLNSIGITSIFSVVMIYRTPNKSKPDWFGFQYDKPDWLVGYGLDNNQKWRNLPSIFKIG